MVHLIRETRQKPKLNVTNDLHLVGDVNLKIHSDILTGKFEIVTKNDSTSYIYYSGMDKQLIVNNIKHVQ